MVKRKIRHAQKANLFVGEGPTEKGFLGYLKDVYHQRNCGKSVKIESGDGGSPQSVVNKTRRLMQLASYNEVYILLDDDVPCPSNLVRDAAKHGIEILWSTPCIEGLLLDILGHSKFNSATASSSKCKKIFHQNYIPEKKKFQKVSYSQHFPKSLLDKQRKKIQLLDDIIKVIE